MKLALAVAAVTVSMLAAAAQTPVPPADVFEVASIKRNRDGGTVAGLRRFPGGRFEATTFSFRP